MTKATSPGAFFDKGDQRGADEEWDDVNDEEVIKELRPGTVTNYTRAVRLWECYAQRKPGASLTSLKDPKDFMKKITFAIDGKYGDPMACLGTVVQIWKNLTAGWQYLKRKKIQDAVVRSTSNFIKGPLQRRMELALQKRIRRYGTMIHFVILAKQLFGDDWHQYGSPRIRILLWDAISRDVFTSARSGEFIELTARAGSGRGLYFRDVALVVFFNENGDTEFANEVEKDAKGMTFTPGKRPRHSLHEGSGLHPLFCNPMLFRIAILWAMKAFRDFENLDNLLDFRPPEGQDVVQIHWHPDILDKPVYQRENGHIWSSRTYCAQLRDLGFRAKYEVPPQNHDFRAEGLHSIDKKYSPAQRKKHAGHHGDGTYDEFYAPQNPGTDGQGAYFGDTPRTIVNDLFRNITLSNNPELRHSLPAEKQHELESSDEYSAITSQLENLTISTGDAKIRKQRADLLAKQRQMRLKALRQYQKNHPRNPLRPKEADEMGHHRTPFSRIRDLMPIRKRLAEDLFITTPLRSAKGRQVLRDLITLYQSESEVECRPGLEPEMCGCKGQCKQDNKPAVKRWRHIYSGHKRLCRGTARNKAKRGFAEYCFLCSKWMPSEKAWIEHCQSHLDSPETLPRQCDPLIYTKTLAAPGLCFWCLGDKMLPPEARMRQFLDRASWQKHIQEQHHDGLDDRKAPGCPHLVCEEAFESVTKLMFHLQDDHCWAPKQPLKRQRPAIDDEAAHQETKARSGPKRRRGLCGDLEYVFVDETADIWKSEHSPDLELDDDELETMSDDAESTSSLGRISSVPSLVHSTDGEEDDDSDDSEPIDLQFLEEVDGLDLESWVEVQEPESNTDCSDNIDPALRDDAMRPKQFTNALFGLQQDPHDADACT